jgi:hypothetical protein
VLDFFIFDEDSTGQVVSIDKVIRISLEASKKLKIQYKI